jgi:hypothetical protein
VSGPVAASDDRGSVLVLGIGLVAVCLMAFVVLVDAAAAYLQRQQLTALADAAALAGAQGIDMAAYYRDGASASTRLDPGLVPQLARDHLLASDLSALVGLRVDRIGTDGGQVIVGLSAPLDLPFGSDLVDGRVAVESRAQLAYRARP